MLTAEVLINDSLQRTATNLERASFLLAEIEHRLEVVEDFIRRQPRR